MYIFSTNQPMICLLINSLFILVVKRKKINGDHKLPELKEISSNSTQFTQWKTPNPHILEALTRKCLVFILDKDYSIIINAID